MRRVYQSSVISCVCLFTVMAFGSPCAWAFSEDDSSRLEAKLAVPTDLIAELRDLEERYERRYEGIDEGTLIDHDRISAMLERIFQLRDDLSDWRLSWWQRLDELLALDPIKAEEILEAHYAHRDQAEYGHGNLIQWSIRFDRLGSNRAHEIYAQILNETKQDVAADQRNSHGRLLRRHDAGAVNVAWRYFLGEDDPEKLEVFIDYLSSDAVKDTYSSTVLEACEHVDAILIQSGTQNSKWVALLNRFSTDDDAYLALGATRYLSSYSPGAAAHAARELIDRRDIPPLSRAVALSQLKRMGEEVDGRYGVDSVPDHTICQYLAETPNIEGLDRYRFHVALSEVVLERGGIAECVPEFGILMSQFYSWQRDRGRHISVAAWSFYQDLRRNYFSFGTLYQAAALSLGRVNKQDTNSDQAVYLGKRLSILARLVLVDFGYGLAFDSGSSSSTRESAAVHLKQMAAALRLKRDFTESDRGAEVRAVAFLPVSFIPELSSLAAGHDPKQTLPEIVHEFFPRFNGAVAPFGAISEVVDDLNCLAYPSFESLIERFGDEGEDLLRLRREVCKGAELRFLAAEFALELGIVPVAGTVLPSYAKRSYHPSFEDAYLYFAGVTYVPEPLRPGESQDETKSNLVATDIFPIGTPLPGEEVQSGDTLDLKEVVERVAIANDYRAPLRLLLELGLVFSQAVAASAAVHFEEGGFTPGRLRELALSEGGFWDDLKGLVSPRTIPTQACALPSLPHFNLVMNHTKLPGCFFADAFNAYEEARVQALEDATSEQNEEASRDDELTGLLFALLETSSRNGALSGLRGDHFFQMSSRDQSALWFEIQQTRWDIAERQRQGHFDYVAGPMNNWRQSSLLAIEAGDNQDVQALAHENALGLATIYDQDEIRDLEYHLYGGRLSELLPSAPAEVPAIWYHAVQAYLDLPLDRHTRETFEAHFYQSIDGELNLDDVLASGRHQWVIHNFAVVIEVLKMMGEINSDDSADQVWENIFEDRVGTAITQEQLEGSFAKSPEGLALMLLFMHTLDAWSEDPANTMLAEDFAQTWSEISSRGIDDIGKRFLVKGAFEHLYSLEYFGGERLEDSWGLLAPFLLENPINSWDDTANFAGLTRKLARVENESRNDKMEKLKMGLRGLASGISIGDLLAMVGPIDSLFQLASAQSESQALIGHYGDLRKALKEHLAKQRVAEWIDVIVETLVLTIVLWPVGGVIVAIGKTMGRAAMAFRAGRIVANVGTRITSLGGAFISASAWFLGFLMATSVRSVEWVSQALRLPSAVPLLFGKAVQGSVEFAHVIGSYTFRVHRLRGALSAVPLSRRMVADAYILKRQAELESQVVLDPEHYDQRRRARAFQGEERTHLVSDWEAARMRSDADSLLSTAMITMATGFFFPYHAYDRGLIKEVFQNSAAALFAKNQGLALSMRLAGGFGIAAEGSALYLDVRGIIQGINAEATDQVRLDKAPAFYIAGVNSYDVAFAQQIGNQARMLRVDPSLMSLYAQALENTSTNRPH